jgi:replication factor C large subunit
MNPFFASKPEKLAQIVGQDEALNEIHTFLSNFKSGKGLFLYGPYGVGKTSSIYAFAKEHNIELLELNASDSRNQGQIEEFLSNVTGQMSLFNPKKIILLDEVDGLSGMKDRGAASVIAKYIEKSKFPIVVTGLNVFDSKLSPVKKVCKLVEFSLLDSKSVEIILGNVLKKEILKLDEKIVKKISLECGGDARAALNDLFCFVLSESKLEDVEVSERRRTPSMNDALIRVFKSTNKDIFRGAYDDIDEDLDKIFLWLDENLPREYLEIEDLEKGFENLALANRFFGRINRWQYYRFYVYCYELLSAGIALAKKTKYSVPPKYKEPTRILRYWQANMSFAKRKVIVEKIAAKMHVSYKKALKLIYPDLLNALVNDERLIEELDLSDDEISWLKKKLN